MSHTIYAANGKINHIHRRMCERDYTIDNSFVCLQSKRSIDAMLEYSIEMKDCVV